MKKTSKATPTWHLICPHPPKPLTTRWLPGHYKVSSRKKKCPYHFVWYRGLLTDVCWFEAMFNVPVKHTAFCLSIRAHASVIGRWGAHEACVCSGKLLNCFCVYIKDHATENISPSSRLCAQRIWSCAEEEAWETWKAGTTNYSTNLFGSELNYN